MDGRGPVCTHKQEVDQTDLLEETRIQLERGRFSVEEIPGVLGNKACIASYK